MRLIDADALIEELEGEFWYEGDDADNAIDVVKHAPTIEPCKSADQNVADVPSGDLISRADALEQMAQAECGLHYEDCEADNCCCSYIQRILDLPTADRPSNVLQEKKPTPIEDYMIGKSRSADKPQVNSDSAEEQIAETCDRPKGEWVENINFVHLAWECSKCGAITSVKTPFCYECGADMQLDK